LVRNNQQADKTCPGQYMGVGLYFLGNIGNILEFFNFFFLKYFFFSDPISREEHVAAGRYSFS